MNVPRDISATTKWTQLFAQLVAIAELIFPNLFYVQVAPITTNWEKVASMTAKNVLSERIIPISVLKICQDAFIVRREHSVKRDPSFHYLAPKIFTAPIQLSKQLVLLALIWMKPSPFRSEGISHLSRK